MVLHTLDGYVLAVLDALRLEHLAKGALALLGDQAILCGGDDTTGERQTGKSGKPFVQYCVYYDPQLTYLLYSKRNSKKKGFPDVCVFGRTTTCTVQYRSTSIIPLEGGGGVFLRISSGW